MVSIEWNWGSRGSYDSPTLLDPRTNTPPCSWRFIGRSCAQVYAVTIRTRALKTVCQLHKIPDEKVATKGLWLT